MMTRRNFLKAVFAAAVVLAVAGADDSFAAQFPLKFPLTFAPPATTRLTLKRGATRLKLVRGGTRLVMKR